MSRFSLPLTIGLALGCATSLAAQQTQTQPAQAPKPAAPAAAAHDHPAVGAVASATAVATVQAIDQTKREVTLKKENGELVTLVVSEEARNLPQVKKGDRVTVTYQVGLVVALGPPGNQPVRVEDTQAARTPAGAKPGGIVQQTIAVTATVVEVDQKTRTVTLRGPRQTVALPVADDIDLSKVKVGSQVGAVYQQSLGLLVEEAPK
jgi:Cu/Ag efflux protein CusF